MSDPSVWDAQLKLMLGRTQYEFTVELLRGHTLVWLDGLPLTTRRAASKVKARAAEFDRMVTRMWPFDPERPNETKRGRRKAK